MEKILWWLIAGSRGGVNRARIISTLKKRPYNAHKLSEELNLDYKTVTYHLKLLEDNRVVKDSGEKYGAMYFLSTDMENNYELFKKICQETLD